MPTVQIDKKEAAKRQLKTAIRMFFAQDEPISIHTISCAAHGILTDLCKSQGIHNLLTNNPLVKPEHRTSVTKQINAARNFFKHADNDPKAKVNFSELHNEAFIFDSVSMYEELTHERFLELTVFECWYNAKYPELLTEEFRNTEFFTLITEDNLDYTDLSFWHKVITKDRYLLPFHLVEDTKIGK